MAIHLARYEEQAKSAVELFWGNRKAAAKVQRKSGKLDQGTRGAVTAGKNMDGFASLMADLVRANGLKDATVIHGGRLGECMHVHTNH